MHHNLVLLRLNHIFVYIIDVVLAQIKNFFFNMGGQESKIKNPNANVINEVKIVEVESSSSIYLIIIIAILATQLLTSLYQLHKRSLRKNYMRTLSTADHLDKV